MTSKTIFNMNTKLKKAAMKKAREEGWTLTAMLNQAVRDYVEDRFEIEVLDQNSVEVKRIKRQIRNETFIPWEQVKRELEDGRKRSRIKSPTRNGSKTISSGTKTAPIIAYRFKK